MYDIEEQQGIADRMWERVCMGRAAVTLWEELFNHSICCYSKAVENRFRNNPNGI